MARPIPVLPEVGSMMVSPGLMRPCFSASRIIRLPIRSLTLPPAFMNSHFARISHSCVPLPILLRRTRGVHPTWSRIDDEIRGRSQPGGGSEVASDVIADGSKAITSILLLRNDEIKDIFDEPYETQSDSHPEVRPHSYTPEARRFRRLGCLPLVRTSAVRLPTGHAAQALHHPKPPQTCQPSILHLVL